MNKFIDRFINLRDDDSDCDHCGGSCEGGDNSGGDDGGKDGGGGW